MPLNEFRRIAAFGDPQDDGFVVSFGSEISVEFSAQ
jgi:hypothetical protein